MKFLNFYMRPFLAIFLLLLFSCKLHPEFTKNQIPEMKEAIAYLASDA